MKNILNVVLKYCIPFIFQLDGADNDTLPEKDEWIPVELELVDKIWLPDTEILKLKGFHSLEVLGRLQVSCNFFILIIYSMQKWVLYFQ